MTYYPTLAEDLARARDILEKGRPRVHGDVEELPPAVRAALANTGGMIFGADNYAAYKLLESFCEVLTAATAPPHMAPDQFFAMMLLGLHSLQQFVGDGVHASGCNGGDDGPCDCGFVEPRETIDALIEFIMRQRMARPPVPMADREAKARHFNQRLDDLGVRLDLVTHTALIRQATDSEQRLAMVTHAQRDVHDGQATHDCFDWRHGLRCELCGQWLGDQ